MFGFVRIDAGFYLNFGPALSMEYTLNSAGNQGFCSSEQDFGDNHVICMSQACTWCWLWKLVQIRDILERTGRQGPVTN